jgi:hypothetical protein
MGKVPRWREIRDSAYKDRWDDYYYTWRGRWMPQTRNKRSERSKLISPASMVAVDLTVAEIVEAIFGREQWFDVSDNLEDQEKQDAIRARDLLLEDLYKDGVVAAIVEVVLNGALYGTGVVKIGIDVEKVTRPVRQPDGRMIAVTQEQVKIMPVAIEPGQLAVDPSAAHIDEMLGVAHEFRMPLHRIEKRQADGTYFDEPVGPSMLEWSTKERSESDTGEDTKGAAFITEYHGLVPRKLLAKARLDPEDDVGRETVNEGEDELTEAIITIANEGTLLRAIPNPSIMKDRAILAYQHDNVPNRFWGRGVMEKGSHPQKALDAEMRSRVDSLTWINNPMLAGDITKLPPRMNLNVWPGKFWGMKGSPRETLQEFRFGDVNASTFQQSQELNKMVQDATGGLDTPSLRSGIRDETATGAGISASGFIKRSKRTMYNVEGFLSEMVRRLMWRKMQFEPQRYPQDVDFTVRGTAGIMAREIEQQFMVNLLQFTEQGTPPYLLILKSIFDSSSSPKKGEMQAAIQQMLEPPSEEEQAKAQQLEQMQIQAQVEAIRNQRADTALKLAQGDKAKAQGLLAQIEAEFKDDELFLENLKEARERKNIEIQDRAVDIQAERVALDRQKLQQEKRSVN